MASGSLRVRVRVRARATKAGTRVRPSRAGETSEAGGPRRQRAEPVTRRHRTRTRHSARHCSAVRGPGPPPPASSAHESHDPWSAEALSPRAGSRSTKARTSRADSRSTESRTAPYSSTGPWPATPSRPLCSSGPESPGVQPPPHPPTAEPPADPTTPTPAAAGLDPREARDTLEVHRPGPSAPGDRTRATMAGCRGRRRKGAPRH